MNTKAENINFNIPWQDITPGGEVYEPCTSTLTQTGEWRSNRPVIDEGKCRQCLLCAPYCPDASIPVMNGHRRQIDYAHCKGCGICVTVCPFGAISMVKEGE